MAIDAATINANSQTAKAATTVDGKLSASKASLADSEQTFMALMTAQLKNQDPLSPVDSNQFTQQIVQMTGVEQQLLTNDLLKTLVGMNDAGLSSSVGLIGKEVTTQSSNGALTGGHLGFDFTLPSAASTMTLEVQNAQGQTVATIKPTDMSKGAHSVSWDGKNSAGVQQPDGGLYTLKVTAANDIGTNLPATATSTNTGIVTAVSQQGGATVVTVGGRKIPSTDIISVAEAPAASTTASTQTPA